MNTALRRVVLALVLVCAPLVALPVSADPADDAFVRLATKRAIVLPMLDWQKVDANSLAPLDVALGAKRIAYIGEPDHYIHEKYAARLLFIAYLAKRGYTQLGMEMGRSDGQRVDRYLATGDETWLDRVAIYGDRSGLRTDRDDTPTGLLAKAFLSGTDVEHRLRFTSEEKAFFAAVRKIAPSMRYFGFDVDTHPGAGYADVDALLAPFASSANVASLRAELRRVPGETLAQESDRLSRVTQRLESSREIEAALGSTTYASALEALRTLRDSMAFTAVAYRDPSPQALSDAFARRELTMKRQVLDRLANGQKTILMGHMMHLSKDYTSLRLGRIAGPAAPMWPSIGTFVETARPSDVLSIWMMIGGGAHSPNECPTAACAIAPLPGTLEEALARVGDSFVLPIDRDLHGWFDVDRDFDVNGVYASGRVARQADAIVFVREAHGFNAPSAR